MPMNWDISKCEISKPENDLAKEYLFENISGGSLHLDLLFLLSNWLYGKKIGDYGSRRENACKVAIFQEDNIDEFMEYFEECLNIDDDNEKMAFKNKIRETLRLTIGLRVSASF